MRLHRLSMAPAAALRGPTIEKKPEPEEQPTGHAGGEPVTGPTVPPAAAGTFSAYGVSTQVFASDSAADIVRRHPGRFEVDDQGRLVALRPPEPMILCPYLDIPPMAEHERLEPRPRSKRAQRARDRRWG